VFHARAKLSNNHEPSGDAQTFRVAALIGTAAFPDKIQATQTVAMKPISLPELPPKPSKDIAATLFPGFVQTEFAPAERPSLFSTKATDHQCSFCMDIPRPT
jgi:hypothetical protein